MIRYHFQATLHLRPADVPAGPTWRSRGLSFETLAPAPGHLAVGFDRTFEQVADALGAIDRMFFEPDGSFVWVVDGPTGRSQLDGMLYDRDGRLLYVELKGTCTPDELDAVLTTLGWPSAQILFQLQREAVFLAEPDFRRFAAQAAIP